MITKIDIKNFKSLECINVKTQNLNLLMGLNGMGKSSLLQTLLLLKQSRKLEDGVVDLNGDLVQIGQGKDAFYQYAEEDFISLAIQFKEERNFSWKFHYDDYKDRLTAEEKYTAKDIEFFRDQIRAFQYLTAERIGPRDLHEASSTAVIDEEQLGLSGEYAVHFINVFGAKREVKEALRHREGASAKLNAQIDAWLGVISPGVSLNTTYLPEVNKVRLDYRFKLPDAVMTNAFRPRNVGFGISYVLPVVLALLTVEEGKILLIENPESHVHPKGQAELGKLIALAAQANAQIFLETHSDHILNGIRVAVKEKCIDKEKVSVLYFNKYTDKEKSFTRVHPLRIDGKGTLSDEPEGLLDEWETQLLKLF